MYFGFVRLTFFTDDGCEHAKMKQFTLFAGNSRSQYILCLARTVGFLTRNHYRDLLKYSIGASVLKR